MSREASFPGTAKRRRCLPRSRRLRGEDKVAVEGWCSEIGILVRCSEAKEEDPCQSPTTPSPEQSPAARSIAIGGAAEDEDNSDHCWLQFPSNPRWKRPQNSLEKPVQVPAIHTYTWKFQVILPPTASVSSIWITMLQFP